jgi:uncharacterized protein (TIGR03067 family)
MRFTASGAYAILVLVVAGNTRAVLLAEDKKDALQEEMKRLEGTWTVTSMNFMGTEIGPLSPTIVIKGDKWVFKSKDGDKEGDGNCTCKIDPTKNPKTIDLRGEEEGKEAVPGIYAIDGDKLWICFAAGEEGKPIKRPEDFETKGKAVMLIMARREK